jgi:hypothetical protein
MTSGELPGAAAEAARRAGLTGIRWLRVLAVFDTRVPAPHQGFGSRMRRGPFSSPESLAEAKAEAFELLEGMREPDQKIRRTMRFGLTVARKGRR